jgi:hypothetical protein
MPITQLLIGILREITGKARNRIFRADEILEIIDKTIT